jgi:protein-disulfide isomerase
VDDILAKYPNDVKVVIKNFPLSFHKQARRAAQYALAADKQGKFKEMYHAIMDNFRELKTNEDYPVELAAKIPGIDVEQLKRDANDPAIDAQIQKEFDQMRSSGIPRLSVPKFLVAGKEPQGRDLATFSAMIDAELKKGKK